MRWDLRHMWLTWCVHKLPSRLRTGRKHMLEVRRRWIHWRRLMHFMRHKLPQVWLKIEPVLALQREFRAETWWHVLVYRWYVLRLGKYFHLPWLRWDLSDLLKFWLMPYMCSKNVNYWRRFMWVSRWTILRFGDKNLRGVRRNMCYLQECWKMRDLSRFLRAWGYDLPTVRRKWVYKGRFLRELWG